MRWPKEWNLPFHDVEVKFAGELGEFLGRRLASNFDLAFVIAGAEALERYCASDSASREAGGIAVHQSAEKAARNALFECVEREVFFAHFLTKTPPLRLLTTSDLSLSPFRDLSEKLQIGGVDWVFAQLASPPGVKVVMCAAFGEKAPFPFGVVLGLGVGLSESDAMQRAFGESVGNVVGIVSGELLLQPFRFDAAIGRQALSGEERFRWGLSLECGALIKEWLLAPAGSKCLPISQNTELADVEVFRAEDYWNSRFDFLTQLTPPPLFFARASFPNGLTISRSKRAYDEDLVLRLETLLDKKISISSLVDFPPPIG
jgi:hypothetical protein